jgi:hypothetical protein
MQEKKQDNGDNYITSSFKTCVPHRIFLDKQIKEGEVGGSCEISCSFVYDN